ncbi:MAG TPA: aromatic ring-hydroxylating dioxygenase subunit alpha [Sphingobium sp.]|nr:aromatic ring-hydroxylating dioxygenase subunit alpha [Sphingobium sp.]
MQYVENSWYVASWSDDLGMGEPMAVQILGEPIVLWRSPSNQLTALIDRCPHRLAPLSLGRCEGEHLRCMYHGFLLNHEGRTIEVPGQDKLPPQAVARRFPVVERHSWIWIWMGDVDKADTDLIPRAFGFDDDRWLLGRGFLDYEAEAGLICDNLLDFSHLQYVHANSFGSGDNFTLDQPIIRKIDRGVRISRWIRNTEGPGSAGRAAPGSFIDYWNSYDFLLPGVLIMESGSFPQGSADRFGSDGPPDMSQALRAWAVTSQAVTPVAPGKARYFFSTGPHRDHGTESDRDAMVEVAKMAFAEDKVMIEAQYRNMQMMSDPRFVPSAHDRAVTIFNGLVRQSAGKSAQQDV